MQTVAESSIQAPKRSTGESGERVVTVCIGNEIYGIPIELVESIVRWEPLTHLPRLPHFVSGIYSMRGKAIPVIDLRKRLAVHADECGPEHRIVITHIHNIVVGLIVNSVREVTWIESDQMETKLPLISNEGGSSDSDYLRGVAHLAQGFVILIDLAQLLSISEQNLLTSL
jgi:purine-binding chemotaxis protein CheW